MTTVTRSTASSSVTAGNLDVPHQIGDPDLPLFLSGRFADDRPLRLRMFRPGNGTLIIEASGALDTTGSHHLAEALHHRLTSTASHVVLDASGVAYSNTSGIATLLNATLNAKERGKSLTMVSSEAVDRLVDLLGVTDKLSFAASPDIAMR